MRWLVTGGSGFIGSAFLRRLLAEPEVTCVVNLDLLTYAANPDSTADLEADGRYTFVRGDIADPALVARVLLDHRPDMLVNMAAESHVDRSIQRAAPFLHTNVEGTQVLLDAWRRHPGGRRFLQVSTDEVYGSLGPDGTSRETDPLMPTSPYAASKAAAELLAAAAARTWGLDVVITRSSNNLGPRQHPEKLIPRMISRALHDRPLPVFGTGLNVRDWLFVEDHCEALFRAATRGWPGEVFNIGGGQERTNLQVVEALLDLLGKPRSLVTMVEDRPGHDWRYALDTTLVRERLGWRPMIRFEEALEHTVAWYIDNPGWWRVLVGGLTGAER